MDLPQGPPEGRHDFAPQSPSTCVAFNDDSGKTGQSQVEGFILDGETPAIVTSALGTPPIGTYTLEVETLP